MKDEDEDFFGSRVWDQDAEDGSEEWNRGYKERGVSFIGSDSNSKELIDG